MKLLFSQEGKIAFVGPPEVGIFDAHLLALDDASSHHSNATSYMVFMKSLDEK